MRLRTLEEAMQVAWAMRQLRNVEMEDARRFRLMRDRCTKPDAKRVCDAHVRNLVAVARKWNRQMLIAQRMIRTLIEGRMARRFDLRDRTAPAETSGPSSAASKGAALFLGARH